MYTNKQPTNWPTNQNKKLQFSVLNSFDNHTCHNQWGWSRSNIKFDPIVVSKLVNELFLVNRAQLDKFSGHPTYEIFSYPGLF